jgi:hypothetical protein
MENSANNHFYVGCAGWEHPQWVGGFYPDEMPPEWRLTFYNTAFPCVYLAYEEWSGRDLKTLRAWVEDTLEPFRFVLEPGSAGLSDGDRDRLAALAPRLDPLGGQVVWLEGKPDLKRLAGELKVLAGCTGPVYLIRRDHDLEAMDQLKILLEIMGL